MEILAFLVFAGAAITYWLFRKGGMYNPVDPFPPKPNEPVKPPEPKGPPQPPPEPPKPPVEPPRAPQTPSKATLLCLGIKGHEGWILPGGVDWSGRRYPNGSASYRNNNPGNVRFYEGGYHPMYGNVLRSPGNFAIFRDYATGWLYLNNMVRGLARKYPNLTLYEFFAGKKDVYSGYAPKEDHNDPESYAKEMGRILGVDSKKFKLKDLVV